MQIKQFDIWIAGLNPQIGTESGKTRPVVIIQTNLLNKVSHPSTIICSITTKVNLKSNIIRVHLVTNNGELLQPGDVMIDQIRAIDNKRLTKKIGALTPETAEKIKENINIILELD